MTRPDCTAATQRLHHVYRSDCQGCKARDIARGPVFFKRNEEPDAYRELLARVRLSPAAVARASAADKERTAA